MRTRAPFFCLALVIPLLCPLVGCSSGTSALPACGTTKEWFTHPPVASEAILFALPMGDLQPPLDLLPNGEGGFKLNDFEIEVAFPGDMAIVQFDWTLLLASPSAQGLLDYTLRFAVCEDDDGTRVHGEFAHIAPLADAFAAQLVDDWGIYLPSSADFADISLDGPLTDEVKAEIIAEAVSRSGGSLTAGQCEVYRGGVGEVVLKCQTRLPGSRGLVPEDHFAVAAGSVFGYAGGNPEFVADPWGLDFNLYDDREEWPFLRTERGSPVPACLYEYFVDTLESPLRSTYLELVGRADGTCGTLDIDRVGTAAGIWISRDHPEASSVIPMAVNPNDIAHYLLTLAPHYLEHDTRQMIGTAIPGLVDSPDQLPLPPVGAVGAVVNPPFESVTVGSGVRCYSATTHLEGDEYDLFYLLELVDDGGTEVLRFERIAEACDGLSQAAMVFSDAAHELVR